MARSVYVPSRAAQVAYADASWMDSDGFDWEDAVYNLKGVAQSKYRSLDSANRWIGNEGRVLLENKLVSVGVSEYCGLVAVWVIPEAGYGALAERFADKFDVESLAECFGERLVCRGRFSNGEAVFDSAKGPNKGEMGLGFSSKEGWL